MKNMKTTLSIILVFAIIGLVACGGSPAGASTNKPTATTAETPAEKADTAEAAEPAKASPAADADLPMWEKHPGFDIPDYSDLDVPDDRLFCVATFGGEKHLYIAEEHKTEGTYGKDFVKYYIDTDEIDAYETEDVSVYFECPVCGYWVPDHIREGDSAKTRIGICKCEQPWVLGVTIDSEQLVEDTDEPEPEPEDSDTPAAESTYDGWASELIKKHGPTDQMYACVKLLGNEQIFTADEVSGVYYLDTDGMDGYERELIEIVYMCPLCGAWQEDSIQGVGGYPTTSHFSCDCAEPYEMGFTVDYSEKAAQ